MENEEIKTKLEEVSKMLEVLKQTFLDTMHKTKIELQENMTTCIIEQTAPIKSKLETVATDISGLVEFRVRLERVEKRTVRMLGELSGKGFIRILEEEKLEIEREFGKLQM